LGRASEVAEKVAPDDRSLWSRLGKRLVLRSADSEPRPQEATCRSFSAASSARSRLQAAALPSRDRRERLPPMTSWLLVSTIVGATVLGDLLQSIEMKRHGEIRNFHPRGLPKLFFTLVQKKFLILGIFFMAISFFAFMTLLETADLSFAVPVTAASLVLETILAKLVLKERVDARRWVGALLVLGGVVLLAQ
jgi:drug/metabolite transporter (DMT)-like permease